jgi:hypothetical protein
VGKLREATVVQEIERVVGGTLLCGDKVSAGLPHILGNFRVLKPVGEAICEIFGNIACGADGLCPASLF